MSLDDVIYMVHLVEMSLDDIGFVSDDRIKWPRSLEGTAVPRVDGVLVLYDVTNEESSVGIPELLRSCPELHHLSNLHPLVHAGTRFQLHLNRSDAC